MAAKRWVTLHRRTWRGLGHVPGYGHHPGTMWVVFFVGLGAVAGGWAGAAIMAAIVVPLFLVGAYSRGGARCAERNAERERAQTISGAPPHKPDNPEARTMTAGRDERGWEWHRRYPAALRELTYAVQATASAYHAMAQAEHGPIEDRSDWQRAELGALREAENRLRDALAALKRRRDLAAEVNERLDREAMDSLANESDGYIPPAALVDPDD